MNSDRLKKRADVILHDVRKKIRKASGDNYDSWFTANRFVYARLQLDERKLKGKIKKILIERKKKCGYRHCPNKTFLSEKNIDLHRIDLAKGYSQENCVLLHPACHRKVEAYERKRLR